MCLNAWPQGMSLLGSVVLLGEGEALFEEVNHCVGGDFEVFPAQAPPSVESSLLLAACRRQAGSFWLSSDQDVELSAPQVCCRDDDGLNL